MRSNNRKTYFIKKDFQARFILRFVTLATAWAAATVLVFAYLAMKKVDELRYSSTVDINTTGELLLPITVGVQVFSLLAFAGILAYTIRSLWRKLSRPLSKIKSGLGAIAAGDLTQGVVMRMNDEFQDLAADVEGMRLSLREKIVAVKERERALSSAASELNKAALGNNATPAHVGPVLDALERMKKDLQAFQA